MKLPDRPIPAALSEEDEAALTDLYVRGTPANTLRAYERDLLYITTWKQAAFGSSLQWPETETVALRFILDHARDLSTANAADPARIAAEALLVRGHATGACLPGPIDAGSPHCLMAGLPPDEEPRQPLRCPADPPGPRKGPPGGRTPACAKIRQSDHPRCA